MNNEKLVTAPPAVESLLDYTKGSLWPPAIRSHSEIAAQARMRQDLLNSLNKLFAQVSKADTEISSALASNDTNSKTVAEAYETLADFLDDDPLHRRLVLYLPFELLPDAKWQPASPRLAGAVKQFSNTYLWRWRELLKEVDVRANFFDGNILEPELSPGGQNMVCKAAHLIPFLAKKELISVAEVLEILDTTQNEILASSITDTLPVLVEMGLLRKDQIIKYGISLFPDKPKASLPADAVAWLNNLSQSAAFEMQKIAMREAIDNSRGRPKFRVIWERQERENALVESYGDVVADLLTNGLLTWAHTNLFLSSNQERIPSLSVLNGIRKAVEIAAKDSPGKAASILLPHYGNIQELWKQDLPGARDIITSLLLRLAYLRIVDERQLDRFGLELPQLEARVSDNSDLIENELNVFAPTLELMATDPEIASLLYPAVIFFGSRFKGYAKKNADLDLAVFVRLGVSSDERPRIRELLKRIFSYDKVDGKIVEFWLTEEDNRLQVRDFPNLDVVTIADSTWIHLLLAGVWFGQEKAVQEIYSKLLPGFVYSKGKKFDEEDARRVWLDEMEREVLQYRLMHKGYRRLFPEQGGLQSSQAQNLDPQSSFWDSGYRRIATKLFISRVFLPQLAEPANIKGQTA